MYVYVAGMGTYYILVVFWKAQWGIIYFISWHFCFYNMTITSVSNFISSVWSSDDKQIPKFPETSLQNLLLNYCLLEKNIAKIHILFKEEVFLVAKKVFKTLEVNRGMQ